MWYTHTHRYTHTGILFSHKKMNLAICDMDGPWERYAKWNKSDRERQISYDFTYMQNPKKNTNESIYKTDTDS